MKTQIIQTVGKIYRGIVNGLKNGKTIISLQGSARSSKTYNVLIFLINYLLENKNVRLSIVRKTLPAIKGSVLIDFKEILIKMNVWDDRDFNKTELIYHFKNGSWVEFFSTDNEQKIRGRKRHILFVNEANEISYLEWQQLIMRTTLFTIIDYNPSFSEDHWIETVNKDIDTEHFISTYLDNIFLEQTIIDSIEKLRGKNVSLWTVYGLGLRAIIEGLIFESHEVVDEIPAWIKTRWLGVDFGYTNDVTAIVEVAINGDDLYINELCYQTRLLTNEIIKKIKENNPKHLKVISESADPRLVDEIYNSGVNIWPVEKPPGSVNAGLDKMKEYKLKITKTSENVIKERKSYVYEQDKKGKYINVPVDANNHAMDATRYVILMEILGHQKKSNLGRFASGLR